MSEQSPKNNSNEKELEKINKEIEETRKTLEERKAKDKALLETLIKLGAPEEQIQKLREAMGEEKKEAPEIKESKIQNIKNSILNIFSRGGKKETEIQKERNLETMLSEIEAERKDKLEKGPLSLRIKQGIIKGLNQYENWGKDEKDWKGRLGKMAVNLALIGIISTFAAGEVTKYLPKLATESASVVSASVAPRLLQRMAIGLGIGGIIEIAGNKVPKKLKKWLPYILSASAIGVSALATGGIAPVVVGGLSMAAGYSASKLYTGKKYSEEQIIQREQEAKEIIRQKIEVLKAKESKGEKIDFGKVSEIEKEYQTLLKKFERQRLGGKLSVIGLKLLIGSAVSTGTLTAASVAPGAVEETKSWLNEHRDTSAEAVKPEIGTTPHSEEQPFGREDVQGDGTGKTVAQYEKENPVEQKEETENTPVEQKEEIDNKPISESIVQKGEGIEHALIRQIENNPSLAKELGFEGDPNNAKELHSFAGREAHVLAIKTGYVDGEGNEVRVAEAGKVAYEIKIENGNPVILEKNVGGEILETHKEGDQFEEKTDKYEYRNKNIQENLTNIKPVAPEIIDNTNLKENQVDEVTGEQKNSSNIDHPANIKPVAPEIIDNANLKENQVDEVTGKPKIETETNQNNTPKEDTISENTPLTQEQQQIEHAYNDAINKIFPTDQSADDWGGKLMENPGKEFSAEALLNRNYTLGTDFYKPLDMMSSLIKKIHEVTGLEPEGENPLRGPESPDDFIRRGYEYAGEHNILDQIKIDEDVIIQNTTSENLPEGIQAEPIIEPIYPKVEPEKMLEDEKLEIKLEEETPSQENNTQEQSEPLKERPLSIDEKMEVREVYGNIIDKIYEDTTGLYLWDKIGNEDATRFMENSTENPEWKSAYPASIVSGFSEDALEKMHNDLSANLQELKEISGLEPIPKTEFQEGEQAENYIYRALEKIEQLGKTDELKTKLEN